MRKKLSNAKFDCITLGDHKCLYANKAKVFLPLGGKGFFNKPNWFIFQNDIFY